MLPSLFVLRQKQQQAIATLRRHTSIYLCTFVGECLERIDHHHAKTNQPILVTRRRWCVPICSSGRPTNNELISETPIPSIDPLSLYFNAEPYIFLGLLGETRRAAAAPAAVSAAVKQAAGRGKAVGGGR